MRSGRPGEHRRAEQATADALVVVCRAALDGDGQAAVPTSRGGAAHVVVTVPVASHQAGAGPVELDGNTLPLDAVAHLLDDAALGCRTHHRAYDSGRLRLDHHHDDGRPVLRQRDGPAP